LLTQNFAKQNQGEGRRGRSDREAVRGRREGGRGEVMGRERQSSSMYILRMGDTGNPELESCPVLHAIFGQSRSAFPI
jgi:hypothetical protein